MNVLQRVIDISLRQMVRKRERERMVWKEKEKRKKEKEGRIEIKRESRRCREKN